MVQVFHLILQRADRESWRAKDSPEKTGRYKLTRYLITLISRVFPVPLDHQYEKVAAKKRSSGGDPDSLTALIYFLENKVQIKNSFGRCSSIAELDPSFRTIHDSIPGLDGILEEFTISGSAFTGTLFGTTIGLKPSTLEALLKKLLIEAHDLHTYMEICRAEELATPRSMA